MRAVGSSGMASNDNAMKPREGKLPPEEELRLLKAVVKSLMRDASKVLAQIELLELSGPEVDELIHLLNQYLSYTERLCDGRKD
jgi:hypothetical protein